MEWNERFVELFDRCVERYRRGDSNFVEYYSEEDLSFLHGIGCKPRELFDFVEDYVDEQNPSPTSALLIAAVRRDYLLVAPPSPTAAPHACRASRVPRLTFRLASPRLTRAADGRGRSRARSHGGSGGQAR